MTSTPPDLLPAATADPQGAVRAGAGPDNLQILADFLVNALAHWPLVIALVILVLGMLGKIGKGVGLFHLFRDDDEIFGGPDTRFARPAPPAGFHQFTASPAFWSGFGLAIATGLVWMVMHTGAPRVGSGSLQLMAPDGRDGALANRPVGLVALGVVLMASVVLSGWIAWRYLGLPRSDQRDWPHPRRKAEIRRAVLGGLTGLAAVAAVCALVLGLTHLVPEPEGLRWFLGATGDWPALTLIWIALPYLVFVGWIFARPNTLPCLSLFCLLILMALAFGLAGRLAGVTGEFTVLAGLVWIVIANGRAGKYRLPGFEALHDAPEEPASGEVTRHGNMIDPVAALDAWKARVAPDGKPVLVLVAVSGGAYRATFWASLILDRLIAGSAPGGRWPGLADDIRLVTGASGGMVAGAYLVALAAEDRLAEGLTQRILQDTRESLRKDCQREYPIGRDSLSPLVHQMVRRDLWHPLRRSPPGTDRGRVLQAQWRSLNVSFAALHAAQTEGRVPAIILSPMLVETGAVALFSNLDLGAIRRRGAPEGKEMAASVEIFQTFEGTQTSVTLATATRLSATFPYLSPAVSLPTTVDRRVVDAGYYDNYGVDLATGFLDEEAIRSWIQDNCAGVAVIETRAFPAQARVPPPSHLARAFQFLTSPPEALMSARQASQMFRNTQQLHATCDRYAEATGDPGFLQVFTFEAVCDVSMSWYLRLDEIEALEKQLTPPDAEDKAWLKGYMANRTEEELIPLLSRRGEEGRDARRARALPQRQRIADTFKALAEFRKRGG